MGEPSTGEYVIVADLVGTLAYRCNIREAETNPELKARIKTIEKEIIGRFKELVKSAVTIRVVDAEDLASKIFEAAKKIDPNPYIVALDRSYFPKTMHMDPTTEYGSYKIVAHYNKPNLESQADEIVRDLSRPSLLRGSRDTGIILVDVGIASGATMREVIQMLEQRKVKISEIVVGVISPELKPFMQFMGYKVTTVEPVNWSTWVDSRDIFLVDGRQIPKWSGIGGVETKFVPFTDDVEKVSGSSIRDDKKGALTALCFEARTRLLSTLKDFGIDTSRIDTPFTSRLVDAKVRRMKSF